MEMPLLPQLKDGSTLTDIDEGNPIDWFTEPGTTQVAVQTRYQQDGHAMTLVIVERDDEEDGEENALDRDTPRFKR